MLSSSGIGASSAPGEGAYKCKDDEQGGNHVTAGGGTSSGARFICPLASLMGFRT